MHERLERLEQLRHGSRGPLAEKLNGKLGLEASAEVNAKTIKALADLQNKVLGCDDGILSPEMDEILGLCIFGGDSC